MFVCTRCDIERFCLQYLYIEKHIERPFLVTYVRSSLLFIYLLVLCFTPPTRDPCQPADYTVSSNCNNLNLFFSSKRKQS